MGPIFQVISSNGACASQQIVLTRTCQSGTCRPTWAPCSRVHRPSTRTCQSWTTCRPSLPWGPCSRVPRPSTRTCQSGTTCRPSLPWSSCSRVFVVCLWCSFVLDVRVFFSCLLFLLAGLACSLLSIILTLTLALTLTLQLVAHMTLTVTLYLTLTRHPNFYI